jgi:hypothetical protein
LRNLDSGTASPTQVSRAVPLEWDADAFGGDATHPVIWKDVELGKRLTLNFRGLGSVARYTTTVRVPKRAASVGIEIPAMYLTAELDTFYLYDAASRRLRGLPRPPESGDGTHPPSGYGGVIAATKDGAWAFGLYGVLTQHGGSVSRGYTAFYFRGPPGETRGPRSYTVTKIRALHQEPLPAGVTALNTYLMSGTLAAVQTYMDRLYELRANGAR